MNNLEIERKFLVDVNKIPYDFSKLAKKSIEQGYIICKPEIRIRNISDSDYVMTIKSNTADSLVRNEIEFKISKKAYYALMSRNDICRITKNRYVVNEGKYVYEIDIFEGKLKGLAYLEVEFPNREEAGKFVAPSWIGKEVTGDDRYKSCYLAQNSIPLEI